MRRWLSAFAVLGLLSVLGLTLAAAPANAVPTPTSVPGTCGPYPDFPICQADIQSSTTSPFQGQTIEVSGTGYQPNENVRLTINGIHVGDAHTNASGNFDPPVVVPVTLLGDVPLTGTGASGKPYDVDSLVLHVRAAAATSSSGGLASTGVQVAAFTAVGLALILGGALVTVVARRRRSAAHGS